jgi:hypothetical protein
MQKSKPKVSKPKRKEGVPYHNAAYSAFMCLLNKEIKAGDITLKDEYKLSSRPLEIDIIVLKKNKDFVIDTSWGKIFREHNIVEYKSPVDSLPDLLVFEKICGYASIYASQNEITRKNISLSLVCYKHPTDFFDALKKEFGYNILHKAAGIYYIYQENVAIETSLAIQVIVSSELQDSDLVLKALKANVDEATMKQAWNIYKSNKENQESLAYWIHVMALINKEVLNKIIEEEGGMDGLEYIINNLDQKGLLVNLKQNWTQQATQQAMQQGMRQGMRQGEQKGMLKERQRIFDFLRQGHSLEEAEKKFAFA